VYGFVTFIMFGAMYYVIPRLVGHEWPSASLIRWHFGLVLAGIAIYVVALTWAGVAQGLALLDPRLPFEASVNRARYGLIGRSLGGLLMTAGHCVFAWHVWVMFRGRRVAAARPPFHEARPILYTAPATNAFVATSTGPRITREGP
jgi:cytochrome c oxidase cbb3-type subunit 1